jgi:hypothetical protein
MTAQYPIATIAKICFPETKRRRATILRGRRVVPLIEALT